MKSSRRCDAAVVVLFVVVGACAASLVQARAAGAPRHGAAAASVDAATCDQYLPALRDVKGKKVGPSSCVMVEGKVSVGNTPFVRLDMGLDGTVEGYVTKDGDFRGYLTQSPDLVFPQTGDPGPTFLCFATYLRSQGAALTIFYPVDRRAWNGKMWVMAHGRGVEPDESWDHDINPEKPAAPRGYASLMAAQGYVVVETHRVSNATVVLEPNPPATGVKAVLEDGTPYAYAAFNDTARYITDFTFVADNVIRERLGRTPSRTYLYGHSAGARIGRGMNYTPGLNRRPDGRRMYDAMFMDDAAAGTWLPIVMKDGKDVLFTNDAEKAEMVPQLEVIHQMYNQNWLSSERHKGRRGAELGVTHSSLSNKRTNARMLRDKGLSDKYRSYEVRSISHQGSGPGLDVSPMWDRFIAMVDAWVEQGVAPPPSRSDWVELGDTDRDGAIDRPGLAFPEVACPLGIFHPVSNAAGTIAFAPFTGQRTLEPLDRSTVYVDMNRNGYWDYRETPTQAWVRLGLLKRGEPLTREKYVACVTAAAEALAREGFFSRTAVDDAVARARTANLEPAPAVDDRRVER